jgi:2-keto-3-deoxy-L-arabinonate dehydratase
MPSPQQRPYRGVFPVAPTPFAENGDLDLDGQRRVLDCMIDQGVDGICILANYSEQFLLTDEERDVLTDLCLSHVADCAPTRRVCSSTSPGWPRPEAFRSWCRMLP